MLYSMFIMFLINLFITWWLNEGIPPTQISQRYTAAQTPIVLSRMDRTLLSSRVLTLRFVH
mgnify:FL=1